MTKFIKVLYFLQLDLLKTLYICLKIVYLSFRDREKFIAEHLMIFKNPITKAGMLMIMRSDIHSFWGMGGPPM